MILLALGELEGSCCVLRNGFIWKLARMLVLWDMNQSPQRLCAKMLPRKSRKLTKRGQLLMCGKRKIQRVVILDLMATPTRSLSMIMPPAFLVQAELSFARSRMWFHESE